ncbi:hypothetical protein JCM31826_02630 [Thermaurantimonas aggregans]|uniref:Uncharacterized protein n=1 Tax=Thermaurantimonas aggregans TaxID=2173829 RepID=A0A401XIF7_9FLAO|nr:hypothetical protein [Thermaurantimonas aggregans]GCD76781.1 hypothetical protein JCM31826_02630 [Thermaurantimonas aggregans]
MKSINLRLLTILFFCTITFANAQDTRLEKIFKSKNLPFQYEREALRYLVGYPLKNGRAQIVKVTAFHTIGNIDNITISTMVRSSRLKGNELSAWVTNTNKKIKHGSFRLNKEAVNFELEIPVNSTDKSILEALEMVAAEGDKAELELAEGDDF